MNEIHGLGIIKKNDIKKGCPLFDVCLIQSPSRLTADHAQRAVEVETSQFHCLLQKM